MSGQRELRTTPCENSATDPWAELARLIGRDDLLDLANPPARPQILAAVQESPNDKSRQALFGDLPPCAPGRDGSQVPRRQERAYPYGDPLWQPRTRRRSSQPEQSSQAEFRRSEAHSQEERDGAAACNGGWGNQPDFDAASCVSDGAGEELFEYQPPGRLRRGWAVAAIGALIVMGTAGAFGYRALTVSNASSQPPVAEGSVRSAKILSAEKSNEDRADTSQRERFGQEVTTATNVSGPPSSVAPPTQVNTLSISRADPNPNAPKKVRTVAIRPGFSSVTAAPDSASAAAPGTRIAAVSQSADPNQSAANVNAAVLTSPRAATGSDGESETITSPPAGRYVVQLLSSKSKTKAQAAFKELQSKYPNVLGKREVLIRRVEIADKGAFYRAQLGPFVSAAQANEMCGNLKAAGGQCMVQTD